MSEVGDDDEDLAHPRFIRMRAEDTFDAQERVFTRAAYDLQVQAPPTPRAAATPGTYPTTTLST